VATSTIRLRELVVRYEFLRVFYDLRRTRTLVVVEARTRSYRSRVVLVTATMQTYGLTSVIKHFTSVMRVSQSGYTSTFKQ